MRKNRINGLHCLGLGCVFSMLVPAGIARGDMIHYQFSGVVKSIVDPRNEWNGMVHVGDPYTAIFSFDKTSTDLRPDDPVAGQYEGPSASLIMPNLNVQGTSYLKANNDLGADNSTIDELRFTGAYSDEPQFRVVLYDRTATFLTSDILPTITQIEVFSDLAWLEVQWYGTFASFLGTVVIPEPATLGLLLVGMIGLRMRHRNR